MKQPNLIAWDSDALTGAESLNIEMAIGPLPDEKQNWRGLMESGVAWFDGSETIRW